MAEKTKALKAALPHTIPVFTGFVFLGAAYGILMNSNGYGVGWSLIMSLIVFAGSSQYLAISFLTTAFNPLYAFLMILIVNARHLFYGISMLDKYKGTGKLKPFLIFGLCDETFSVVFAAEAAEDISRKWFIFFITLLNYLYWAMGTFIGGIVGSMITFNTTGLDFVLTALFVVIFLGQWKSNKDHKPAIIGLLSSIACLIIFGPDNFIIPSMIVIIVILTLIRKQYMDVEERQGEIQ